ncbi:hypothetical protein DXV75_11025 [Alteromonas aestuariivivens]|uniref:Uncharacterized protein n=1 Tax=Alteromonas aestuariivivens TaxID=1938339 RepID=A0A3D8M5X0_9ALTE|nr:hypothetical protein [Alteromonas aestuariivivens]RDV25143.1 hypothetical protein DXV75_11025 [Alteromonas aestuariivivens]
MTHFLSEYQIAALQEMGICVWQSQQESNSHSAGESASELSIRQAPKSSANSRANGAEKLAQLRSSLTAGKAESASAHALQQCDEPQHSSPLSAQKQAESAQLLSDIRSALLVLGTLKESEQLTEWHVGEQFRVTGNTVVLPCNPSGMGPTEKRRLWQSMCG